MLPQWFLTSIWQTVVQIPILKHNYQECQLMQSDEREHMQGQPLFSPPPPQFRNLTKQKSLVLAKGVTCLVVMHPVQHDLRSPVPPGCHVPGHLIIRVPGQAEIQDLHNTEHTNYCRATMQTTQHKQPGNHWTGERRGGRAVKPDYEIKFHNLWKDTRLEQRRTQQSELCLGILSPKQANIN